MDNLTKHSRKFFLVLRMTQTTLGQKLNADLFQLRVRLRLHARLLRERLLAQPSQQKKPERRTLGRTEPIAHRFLVAQIGEELQYVLDVFDFRHLRLVFGLRGTELQNDAG